ncbi:MAG TPA: trypsin-like peptidase domain-containing protein [Nitrososphaerales archaeon]|nr:trypsin-like peptidase domain-containing protein [Nitrososphaerales archaeon]
MSESSNVLQTLSNAVAEVVSRVSQSVVQVRAGGRGFGSGVVWDDQGHVVTNSHVVGRAGEVKVTTSDGKSYDAKVVGQDRFSDVALLKIENSGAKPIERGDSSNLAVGQFVLALADPFGQKVTATFGIVAHANAVFGGRMPWADSGVVVTDAKLNPGYSGGPLVDASGKMIGMNSAYFANRGIAIPINTLTEILKGIESNDIRRAYLGIVSDTLELPEEVAKEIQQEEGMIVLQVETGTPAKKAGVAVGDIVVRLDSKPVRSYLDLRRILNSKVIGKPTKISVLRAEKLTELMVTPSEAL